MSHTMTSPVKRSTIIVKDMEQSLKYYRDLLGMEVFFQGDIGNPGASQLMGHRISGLRMVVLTVGDSQLGMVGLMELKDPDPPLQATAWSHAVKTGETILVIPTDNMRALHERMLTEGYTVVTAPTRMDVPNRPEIHEMMARDPDGVIINLTHRGPLD